MFAPTGKFREYYDRIPVDVLQPLDGTDLEARIVARTAETLDEAAGPPWGDVLFTALDATRTLRGIVAPFLADYQTDVPEDALPSHWAR